MPRVECAKHGVSQAATPWAKPGSRFTALLEAVVIDWLKEASFSAVARRLGLTWYEVDGIMSRAVERGLARRDDSAPTRIGLDETSFQKRHECVTVVTDLDGRRVLSVVDGRTRDAVDVHFAAIPAESREAVEVVAMDMWRPDMDAAAKWLPNARVCFDRFHVARHLGDAVNAVREQEHRRLRAEGDGTLTWTKYLWLERPASMRPERRTLLGKLKDVCTRTGRVWALKEAASRLWDYVSIAWARKAWLAWMALASRSKLEPMVRAAWMIRTHLEGILNAVVLRTMNAAAESMNARIQRIKRMARGYRNRERFRNAILFHLGGLTSIRGRSQPTRFPEAPFLWRSKIRIRWPTTQNYALRRNPCMNCIGRDRLTPHHSLQTRFRSAVWSLRRSGGQKVVGSNPACPTEDTRGQTRPRVVVFGWFERTPSPSRRGAFRACWVAAHVVFEGVRRVRYGVSVRVFRRLGFELGSVCDIVAPVCTEPTVDSV